MPTPDVSAQDQAHPEADMVQPAPTEELPADAAAPPDCPCDAPSNVEVEAQVEANADGQGSDAHAQAKSIPVTPPFGGQVEPEPEAAGSATIPGARGVEDSTESFEDSQEQRVYSALVAIVDGKVKEETPNAEPTQSKDMDVKTSNKDAPAQEDNADAPDMDPQMDVKDEAETNSDKDAPSQEVNADAPDMDPRMDVKDVAETNSDKDGRSCARGQR